MSTKNLILDDGRTGLIPNLYYKVEDADGADLIAKTNVGITETETGIYSVKITTWGDSWLGKIIWFLNTTVLGAEGFEPKVAADFSGIQSDLDQLTAAVENLNVVSTPNAIVYSTGTSSAYSTVEQADLYFATRLFVSEWSAAAPNQKQTALIEATRFLDKFNYKGIKTSSTQPHEFPRTYLADYATDSVPEPILMAQFEIALAFLKGIDPERERRGAYVSSRRYSSVGTTYDTDNVPEYILYGVPSAVAWDYFYPFIDKSVAGTVKLHRVS